MKGEFERIALLAKLFHGTRHPAVETAIGDDAAVLRFDQSERALVWTVDTQVEGTHFRSAWLSWQDVGFRSFMAAVSDVAAMGAEPVAALSSLIVPGEFDDDALLALAEGQAEAAALARSPVIGGNLARGVELSITTTVLGATARALPRGGARVGDGLHLAGALGMSAAGLAALESAFTRGDASIEACIAHWRRPLAQLGAVGALGRLPVNAAVDISDGLAKDVGHLAEQSGVQVVLDEARLRAVASPALVGAARALGLSELALMLHGGEDYALVVAAPAAPEGFVTIGRVVAAAQRGSPTSTFLRTPRGLEPIEARGYDHFRTAR